MAKLTARGRFEIWKVEKETDKSNSNLTTWEKEQISLMSDGRILRRITVRFKPDPHEKTGRLHDYGWKEWKRLKGEGNPSRVLETLQGQGYKLIGTPRLSEFDTNYAKALEASKKGAVKRAEKSKKEAVSKQAKDGPGYYVRNRYLSEQKPWATNFGPVSDLEIAIEDAVERLKNYLYMGFNYLLPVQVVHASSRQEAEYGGGHVWWTDMKSKEPPADPRQLKLHHVEAH